MLAQIRKIQSGLTIGIVVAIGCTFTSCASHRTMALVDDPNERESTIPWNKQEKWENTGPLSGLTDRR
jgi:hypothetical protein